MAETVSVRIPAEAHRKLRKRAEQEHKTLGEVLDEALDLYEMELMWREAEVAYARVRADPAAWKEWQDETALWDTTSMDGIPNDDEYAEEYRHAAAAATR